MLAMLHLCWNPLGCLHNGPKTSTAQSTAVTVAGCLCDYHDLQPPAVLQCSVQVADSMHLYLLHIYILHGHLLHV